MRGVARGILVRMCFLAFLAATAAVASAREYVVRGVDDPGPDLLARSLANDDGLLLLTSPLTTRKAYLAAVVEKTTLALQHAGYPDAKATAAVETGTEGDRVIVETVPGARYLAAAIEITGLPDDLAGDLRGWLRSQRPPADAVPRAVDTESGWSGTRWFDRRGQPARMEPALWSRGQPAPFDTHHIRDIRAAIARFLRDHGHFAAARGIEKPQATGPRCNVSVARSDDGAVLAVAFADLPSAAVLREVEVAPASRVSSAELCQALGIELGRTVTEHDRLAWHEALRESGRFVRHDVKFKETKPDADGVTGVVAIFDLAAYPHVPPFGQPLSREEEVMLRFRSWLLDTLANDDDLAITWHRGAEEPATAALSISTRSGVLLTCLPGTDDACGMAASDLGLGWYLPRAAGRFEVPLPGKVRGCFTAALDLAETSDRGRHSYPRQFTVAAALEPRPRDAEAAVALTARIEPVACLSLVHGPESQVRWEDDVLVIAEQGVEARFDGPSGRLVSIHAADGSTVAVGATPGLLTRDLEALRDRAGADAYRADAPITSLVEFIAAEGFLDAAGRISAAAGFADAFTTWRPRIGAVASNLLEMAGRGGFATADSHVATAMAHVADDDAQPLPVIPTALAAGPTDPWSMLTLATTTQAWRWLDESCGRDTWPCALVRIATLAAGKDSTGALWEITSLMANTRYGPLANLAAANLIPMETMAVSFARQGQTRLSTAAFHADCEAVRAVLADCGLDRCCVALVRSLDDDEARAIGGSCFGDPGVLLPLVHELHGCASEDEALVALPTALDRWWDSSLRSLVASALAAKTDLKTADKPDTDQTPRR
ncbi:MAG: hypothetical protein KJS77_04920 [Planctomycetes bacterium]|nr:hypothetical protein [Planctomycetota bacterium]